MLSTGIHQFNPSGAFSSLQLGNLQKLTRPPAHSEEMELPVRGEWTQGLPVCEAHTPGCTGGVQVSRTSSPQGQPWGVRCCPEEPTWQQVMKLSRNQKLGGILQNDTKWSHGGGAVHGKLQRYLESTDWWLFQNPVELKSETSLPKEGRYVIFMSPSNVFGKLWCTSGSLFPRWPRKGGIAVLLERARAAHGPPAAPAAPEDAGGSWPPSAAFLGQAVTPSPVSRLCRGSLHNSEVVSPAPRSTEGPDTPLQISTCRCYRSTSTKAHARSEVLRDWRKSVLWKQVKWRLDFKKYVNEWKLWCKYEPNKHQALLQCVLC